jgi:parvulin-like peptidyl-prolyl isomerase
MARRIPLPRLTRRQRLARWQRERQQQAIYVVVFSAILFFVIGLVAWAATDKFYQENLKPALRFDGIAVPMRAWKTEVKYQQTRFYVESGVPAGYENDPQIAEQKASYERSALDTLEADRILDAAANAEGISVTPEQIDAQYTTEWSQFRSRHILVSINKDAPDQTLEAANALAKATAIRDQLRQDPNNQELWNQIAKDNSDDPGSKDSGGELGFVGNGRFVKPFDDAAMALPIGAISDPVKSDFGYHVIQVEERKPPEEHEVVKRWLATGFTLGDIKLHARYDALRDVITKKRQESAVVSPTKQIHVALIQVAAPRPVGGDFQAFTDQLKKVADINAALEKGTDFGEVAKRYSEDASKDQNGDIGWLAKGMLTDLAAETELFNLDAGARSQQHNGLQTTAWYKVLEKADSKDLTDDQKTKIKDGAYSYWLAQQKKAHDIVRLVPGLEFE